jgi:hypothetical protein
VEQAAPEAMPVAPVAVAPVAVAPMDDPTGEGDV